MITCPNCNHQNPEGALQCEACYTPLPVMMACPTCGTPVQANASFCGQCGSDLRSLSAGEASAGEVSAESAEASSTGTTAVSAAPESALKTQNFLAENELAASTGSYIISSGVTPDPASSEGSTNFELPDLVAPDPLLMPEPLGSNPAEANQPSEPIAQPISQPIEKPISQPVVPPASPMQVATQLQTLSVRLRQVQSNTIIEIPRQLSIVRIGKPNEQTPPDIDVSGFSDSEVVSRVHATLRVEGDIYYIEDVGSSNGTYVNGLPLAAGNRHRLRPGDRIALGKGDKVSFIFETA